MQVCTHTYILLQTPEVLLGEHHSHLVLLDSPDNPFVFIGVPIPTYFFLCRSDNTLWGFPGGLVVKNPPANAGDAGLITGLGRAPGEGNGNLLQYSWLGKPMDRGAWRAIVLGVARSQTQLSNHYHITLVFHLAIYWMLFCISTCIEAF